MKPLIFLICAGLVQTCFLSGQERKIITPVKSQIKHVTYVPKAVQGKKPVTLPPFLVIKDVSFTSENSNKTINPNEKAEISLNLTNEGKGLAAGVVFRISTKNTTPGLSYTPELKIGDLSPGQTLPLKVPIVTDIALQNGSAEFTLVAFESNGFDSDPFGITVPTQQFEKPNVQVADAVFSTEKGGKVVKNSKINLKILIQNLGKGEANNVKAELFMNDYCYPLTISQFEWQSLKPGDTAVIDFQFIPAMRYNDTQIPVRIALEEKNKQYARDTVVRVEIDQYVQAKSDLIIQPVSPGKLDFEKAQLLAEVDRNIPDNGIKSPNKYALIIGNEDYTSKQSGIRNEPDVKYARNDAEIFTKYIIKTLGFEEENVTSLADATLAQMTQEIELMVKKARLTNDAEIVFYFAGHGFPDETSKLPYLIPVDANGSNLELAIKLTELYGMLEESNAKKISVFLDACFTGAGRNGELRVASRGIRVKPKLDTPPANVIVLTASSGEETALPYSSKQHGMFTYFVLKKLQESKGDLTYGEMEDYLKKQIPLQSLKVNKQDQHPQVIYDEYNRDKWLKETIK